MIKNKLVIILAVLFCLVSCKSPSYLSDYKDINKNVYGAHIKIFFKKDFPIEGELIALENEAIIIMPINKEKCETIPLINVKYFSIQYANTNNGWLATIPFAFVTPIIHGAYSIISFPVNLISSISLIASKDAQYKLKSKKFSKEELKMYARFPQGVPKNIDVSSIRKNY